jgi:hypothetical protein
VNPLQVHVSSQPTWPGIGAIIFGVWIVAALFAIPAGGLPFLCTLPSSQFLTNYYQPLVVFQLLVSCVFPLCVIAFSYITTACHLVKSAGPIFSETQNPQMNTRKNTAKIVFCITIIFLISYVPYHLWVTYYFYGLNFHIFSAEKEDEYLWLFKLLKVMPIAKLFLSINSCLNPVALFSTSHVFRAHFKRYLTCCCKTKFPPNIIELTRRN